MADKKPAATADTTAATATTAEDSKEVALRAAERSAALRAQFKHEDGHFTGMEVVDQTDIQLPKIKMVQYTSAEVAGQKSKPGQFYNSVTEKSEDSLKCTLLALGKRRTRWPEKFKRGDMPLCWSIDGKTGTDTNGRKINCATCPYQNWDKAKAEGKNKPDCNMGYSWLGLVLSESGEQQLFRFIVSGKSVRPTKGFIYKCLVEGIPQFCFNLELKAKPEANASGSYFVLDYDVMEGDYGTCSTEEALRREALTSSVSALFSRAMEQDIMNEMAHEDEEAAGEVDPDNAAAANPDGTKAKGLF